MDGRKMKEGSVINPEIVACLEVMRVMEELKLLQLLNSYLYILFVLLDF